jgi:hypothetical protein
MGSYIQELEPLGKQYAVDEYCANGLVKHSAERLIELIVEAAVDINGLIATMRGLPPPKDYYVSFLELGQQGVYPYKFRFAKFIRPERPHNGKDAAQGALDMPASTPCLSRGEWGEALRAKLVPIIKDHAHGRGLL